MIQGPQENLPKVARIPPMPELPQVTVTAGKIHIALDYIFIAMPEDNNTIADRSFFATNASDNLRRLRKVVLGVRRRKYSLIEGQNTIEDKQLRDDNCRNPMDKD